MRNTHSLRTAALAVIAAVALVGCTSEETPAPAPSSSPSATAQTEPEQRLVYIVDVIDPVTFTVTPGKETDELYGSEFTLHHTGITTPVEGECGYEEVMAFAEPVLLERPWSIQYESVTDGIYIDQNEEHHGFLGSGGVNYDMQLIQAGYAYLTDPPKPEWLNPAHEVAEQERPGLWTSCPGFGE